MDGSRPNSLTPEADVVTMLLQLKYLIQGQTIGVDDGPCADIDSNALIHCFGCWRKLKWVSRVLSESCPLFGASRILCEFLFLVPVR